MKRCRNPRCGEPMQDYERPLFCFSCRYVARWAFALGAFVAGAVWGVVRLVNK
jgi:hypothetical protein